MQKTFNLICKSFYLYQGLMTKGRIKFIVFTFTLLISPIIVKAESTICTESHVIYESRPAIKTECDILKSTGSRLTQGINRKSLNFAKSMNAGQRLGNIFGIGIIVEENGNEPKTYIQGFTDQKIFYEGAELERIYKIMLGRQFKLEPIRTKSQENPFSSQLSTRQ